LDTTLTINGTAYDDAARAAARVKQMTLTLSLDDYDELAWVEDGCGPIPTWRECQAVELSIDATVRFRGQIAKISRKQSPAGWEFAYSTYGLARLADFVPVLSRDGSGEFAANTPPTLNDPSYVASLTGLTVGEIVAKVLTVPTTAAALDGYGVGGYDMTDPDVPALPSETLADLALLDVVPPQGVVLSGHGIVNQLKDFIGQWHRSRYLYIRPDDGVIRVFNVTDPATTNAIVVPGDTDFDTADPVEWPSYDRDVTGCYSRVEVVGRDIQTIPLSTKDGTLTPVQGTGAAWTSIQEAAWRITDFAQPRDARDEGTLSSVSTTGCTITSADALKVVASNAWNDQQATILLLSDAATGAEISEERIITSNTAMSAGGTSDITWDSSMPLSSVGYTRYRISGRTGSMSMVGRKFLVRNPFDDTTGLDCFVGAHLVTAFPHPVAWSVGASVTNYTSPIAAVFWSIDGSANGYNEITVPIQVDPEQGAIIAAYPVVQASAPPSQLAQGYPTTYADGLPTDVMVLVAFNRGELSATSPDEPIDAGPPATGHSGGAYDQLGLERILTIPVESWTWIGDRPAMLKLAETTHESVRDPIDEGSVTYHGVPAWDCLTLGYGLELSLSGGAESPWDGLVLMVREVTLSWPPAGNPDINTTAIRFSNRCRPWEGQSLYLHPAYSGQGFDYAQGDMGDFLLFGSDMGPQATQPFPEYHLGSFDDGSSAMLGDYFGGLDEALGGFQGDVGSAMAAPGAAVDAFQGQMADAMNADVPDVPFRPSSRPKASFWEPIAVTDSAPETPPPPPPPPIPLSQRRGVDLTPPAPEPPPPTPVADTRPLSERRGVKLDDDETGGGG
jgi:hypothetical protein